MSFLLAALVSVLLLPLVLVLQAALFRFTARWAGEVEVGWGRALITVIVAGLAQTLATGVYSAMLLGGDLGLSGALVGLAVWAACAAALTDLTFGKAALVGLVMTVTWWLLGALSMLLLVVTGVAALLGLAGLAL